MLCYSQSHIGHNSNFQKKNRISSIYFKKISDHWFNISCILVIKRHFCVFTHSTITKFTKFKGLSRANGTHSQNMIQSSVYRNATAILRYKGKPSLVSVINVFAIERTSALSLCISNRVPIDNLKRTFEKQPR